MRPDGTVDLAGSLTRELVEETGLHESDYTVSDGWIVVQRWPTVAMMRLVTLKVPAEEGAERIRALIAASIEPELKDVRIVRGTDDIDPRYHAAFPAIVLRVGLRSAIAVSALGGLDHAHGLGVASGRARGLSPVDLLLDPSVDRGADVPHRQIVRHDGPITIDLALTPASTRESEPRRCYVGRAGGGGRGCRLVTGGKSESPNERGKDRQASRAASMTWFDALCLSHPDKRRACCGQEGRLGKIVRPRALPERRSIVRNVRSVAVFPRLLEDWVAMFIVSHSALKNCPASAAASARLLGLLLLSRP